MVLRSFFGSDAPHAGRASAGQYFPAISHPAGFPSLALTPLLVLRRPRTFAQ